MSMTDIMLATTEFNPLGYWTEPIDKLLFVPTPSDLDLFDQNGYDLTQLEQHFSSSNGNHAQHHRSHRVALKQPWFTQQSRIEGSVLNHSQLFERKGYKGKALEQLEYWSKALPLVHKVIALRPKWGLDFSMDYVDRQGNAFEVLHWEWDSLIYDEVVHVKDKIEPNLLSIDWQDAAKTILAKKDQWHHLGFFEQSDWKCAFFGIPKEQFKMVAWS